MALIDEIKQLTKSLYPTGRAFKMPVDSEFQKLHDGINPSLSRAYQAAKSILDSILPDNANFTIDDANQWEVRLGLITNQLVPLADRKLAIQRKMNHPGAIKARQHFKYMEGQLRAAGFDVYVFENISQQSPLVVTGGFGGVILDHGDINHGPGDHGENTYGDIVARNLDPVIDAFYDIGPNLSRTFFVGGNPLGTFADVDVNRRLELRELIFKIKPVETIGFLIINYV